MDLEIKWLLSLEGFIILEVNLCTIDTYNLFVVFQATGSIQIPAMSQSLIFTVNENPDETVLIPEFCPVPVRRSSHLTVDPESPICVVHVYLKNEKEGTRTQVAEVKVGPS